MPKFLLICLMLLATGLGAQAAILGIPVPSLREACPAGDMRESVMMLSTAGYDILHYDASYVIAVRPQKPGLEISGAVTLSEFPPRQHLYLFSGLPQSGRAALLEAGSILLEMDTALLAASDLIDQDLRQAVSNQFTELSLEPMQIRASTALPHWNGEFRTDVAQLVTSVSADSILARIQHLQDFGTRHAYTETRLPVAQWIQQQFQSFGISDVQLQEFTYNSYRQYNVIATLPGTLYPEQYIIIGGHHDSITGVYQQSAPGADDNASGATAVMELARVMMLNNYQPKVSIRFMTFACEELGLRGSYNDSAITYANELDVRLMINFDMIGNNRHDSSEWKIRQIPYDGSLDYTNYANAITEQYTTLESYADNGWFNCSRSDSYPYWLKGYNIIYFFEEDMDSSVYHTVYDVVDSLEIDYCTEVIKGAVACAAIFANMEEITGIPLATPATDISPHSFTANWESVPDATGYWLDVYQKQANGPASELFFSEYLEGANNNKALEIYNGTGSTINLGDYRVEYYSGASANPTQTCNLTGSLADRDTYVIAHLSSNINILDRSDLRINTVTSFDGDDQLALRKISTNSFVDIIGRIGTDPGTQWGYGTLVTKDRTLVRKSTINGGVTVNPVSGFPTLATEWESYFMNSYSRLGSHSRETINYLPGYENHPAGLNTSCVISGLEPAQSYYYVVRSDLGYGSFGNSNQISVTTTLETPSLDLTISESGLILSWPVVEGALSYRVEAAETPYGDYIPLPDTTSLQCEIDISLPMRFFRVTAIH